MPKDLSDPEAMRKALYDLAGDQEFVCPANQEAAIRSKYGSKVNFSTSKNNMWLKHHTCLRYKVPVHSFSVIFFMLVKRFSQVMKGPVGTTLCQNETELKFFMEIDLWMRCVGQFPWKILVLPHSGSGSQQLLLSRTDYCEIILVLQPLVDFRKSF